MKPIFNSRYWMFGLLYFAQGAIMSYFTALNALYLLSFDVSLTQIGLMSAIALIPFVLKVFLGMLSDAVSPFKLGHRKPYIIFGLLLQAVCLLLVPTIHPGQQFTLFAALALLLMSGMALYDTATDGLALDTVQPEEQGLVQGIMVGGRALGVVAISAIIGIVAERSSWQYAFWILAALTLIPLPLVLRVRETARPTERRFTWGAFKAFRAGPIIALGALGALYSLITNAANQIVNPFLESTFQISLSTAGLLTTVWGLGVVFGSLAGGKFIDHTGRRKAVLVALSVSLVSIGLLAAIVTPWMAWPLVFLFGLAFGYYETVYFAVSMQVTDPRIAASMFSILMAIANVGTGIGLALSGTLADSIGYQPTFLIIAALNLVALPLVGVIFHANSSIQEKRA